MAQLIKSEGHVLFAKELHELDPKQAPLHKRNPRSPWAKIQTGIRQAVSGALRWPKPAYRWLGFAVLVMAVGLIFRPSDQAVNIPLISREPAVDEAQMRVQLLAPANRGSVHESQPDFRWTGPLQVQTYSFLLLDGNGEIVWEQQTNERQVTLPNEIQLQPATTYFWQVEGLWPDEGSIVSEMVSFTYSPK